MIHRLETLDVKVGVVRGICVISFARIDSVMTGGQYYWNKIAVGLHCEIIERKQDKKNVVCSGEIGLSFLSVPPTFVSMLHEVTRWSTSLCGGHVCKSTCFSLFLPSGNGTQV